MKSIITCLFLICAFQSYSQQKNDSKIIVIVADTSNLINRITLSLYDKGYTMEEKDNTVGFLLTKEKFERKVVGSRKIKALIKGNTIEFTGLCRIELSTFDKDNNRFEPVLYKGMKGSLYMVAWHEMEEIAKQFGPVTYSK